ncbi:MAG: LAGLIDADG family homing endonuclease [Candidatus Moranbacteria bacterium]|nr:LAGLIDADG family homing endonuclease [Candidatus Moranbacteria bacterium]
MTLSINPNWITGFTDGEGCFAIVIYARDKKKTPCVQFSFSIGLAERDLNTVKKIQKFFRAGFYSVRKNKGNKDAYFACSGPNIIKEKIIPHFDKFPLQTEKRKSYKLWKKAIKIWQSKLPKEIKLLKLVGIREKMNPKGRKKPTVWSKKRINDYFKNADVAQPAEHSHGKSLNLPII